MQSQNNTQTQNAKNELATLRATFLPKLMTYFSTDNTGRKYMESGIAKNFTMEQLFKRAIIRKPGKTDISIYRDLYRDQVAGVKLLYPNADWENIEKVEPEHKKRTRRVKLDDIKSEEKEPKATSQAKIIPGETIKDIISDYNNNAKCETYKGPIITISIEKKDLEEKFNQDLLNIANEILEYNCKVKINSFDEYNKYDINDSLDWFANSHYYELIGRAKVIVDMIKYFKIHVNKVGFRMITYIASLPFPEPTSTSSVGKTR